VDDTDKIDYAPGREVEAQLGEDAAEWEAEAAAEPSERSQRGTKRAAGAALPNTAAGAALPGPTTDRRTRSRS
jgi:hypothetical protein